MKFHNYPHLHIMYPWHLSPSTPWWLTNMPAPWNGSGTDHQSIGASLWPQPDVSGSDVARVTPLLSESLTTIRRLAATCHQGSQQSQCRPIRGQWWGSIDQSEAGIWPGLQVVTSWKVKCEKLCKCHGPVYLGWALSNNIKLYARHKTIQERNSRYKTNI